MQLRILAVGKLKQAGLEQLVADYCKRSRALLPIELVALRGLDQLRARAGDCRVVLDERGDRIEETESGKKFTYEVMPLGTEPHWRYSDPHRKTLRIHTKHISTETP